MLRTWIISALAWLMPTLAETLAKKLLTPESAMARREKDRLRWYTYRQWCETRQNKIIKLAADWIGVYMKFRTPPGEAHLETKAQGNLCEIFGHLANIRSHVEKDQITRADAINVKVQIDHCVDIVKQVVRMLDEAK